MYFWKSVGTLHDIKVTVNLTTTKEKPLT